MWSFDTHGDVFQLNRNKPLYLTMKGFVVYTPYYIRVISMVKYDVEQQATYHHYEKI